MSAYVTLPTPLVDQEVLLKALADLGFAAEQVEVHGQPVSLYGYEGARRDERAHVVIRREHIGELSNDIGFESTASGYRAHISDFDRERFGTAWMRQLHRRYEHHDALKQQRLEREAREAADREARRQAEIEAARREEERRRLVEAQRQAITEKARGLGYRVEESHQDEKVRLVLAKRVY